MESDREERTLTHADAHAPEPAGEQTDAKSAANRDAGTAALSRMARAGTPPQRLDNFDALVEQLAHGMVDRDLGDADRAFIAANGYSAGEIVHGPYEFVMRIFSPTEPGHAPVVAFRGTVPTKIETLLADLDPSGVGMTQFRPNMALIHEEMQRAAGKGPVVSAGHSLGGALAQLSACTYPDLVSRIVTFQSPGINARFVEELKQYNAAHPDKAIESSHHRMEGDLIPLAGEALTPGVIHEHKMQGGNLIEKHTTMMLAQEELAAGVKLPVQNGARVKFDKNESSETQQPGAIERVRSDLGALPGEAEHLVKGAEQGVEKLGKKLGSLF